MKFNFDLDQRKTYTYQEYKKLIDDLMQDNKTTGIDFSEAYLNYTKMNMVRMNRLDKSAVLNSHLSNLAANAKWQTWLVLTEAWCGDAAQNLPWFAKIAESSKRISLKLILRDENLDIMDNYLTNNGRSIPKLIAIDAENNEIFNWGPRPQEIQSIYAELKQKGMEYQDISEKVHAWYAKNKGQSIQNEFTALLNLVV